MAKLYDDNSIWIDRKYILQASLKILSFVLSCKRTGTDFVKQIFFSSGLRLSSEN